MSNVIEFPVNSELFERIWPIAEAAADRAAEATTKEKSETLMALVAVLGRSLAIVMQGDRGRVREMLVIVERLLHEQALWGCEALASEKLEGDAG